MEFKLILTYLYYNDSEENISAVVKKLVMHSREQGF